LYDIKAWRSGWRHTTGELKKKKLFMVWSRRRLLAFAGGGVRGAGGQVYWVWKCGEGWVLEIHCYNVNCTYGEKTLDQGRRTF